MPKRVWTHPRQIEFKVSPVHDLRGRVAGDWDIKRRFPFATSVKARAILQRYQDGARWEETDLFRDVYARRFQTEREIRGARSLEELALQYYDRVDALHNDMARRGFVIVPDLPEFYIGREGEIFIGNQGNHRLAIAHVLGLDRIAGVIRCKHPSAP